MKRTITTIMTLLLCVCMVFGLAGCANQEDIDNAIKPTNEQISQINATLEEMQTLDITLDGYINALQTVVDILETDNTANKSEIQALKTTVADLQEKDIALAASIEDLESLLTDKIADTKDWSSETFATIAECIELKSAIYGLQSDVAQQFAAMKETTDALEAEIEELEKQINCLNGNHVAGAAGEVEYTWAEDYSTCTASVDCAYCESGKATETVNAVEDENIVATFENELFEEQTVYTVTTYDELSALFALRELVYIRLDASLENLSASSYLGMGTVAFLDLNGNDIQFASGYGIAVEFGSLTLTGAGKISNSESITINVQGELGGVYIEDDVVIENSTGGFAIYCTRTLMVTGGTVTGKLLFTDTANILICGGEFSNDPTEYVDTNKYTVTQNKDGMYVVTVKTAEADYEAAIEDLQNAIKDLQAQINCLKGIHTEVCIDNGDGTHSRVCPYCDEAITELHNFENGEDCECGKSFEPYIYDSAENVYYVYAKNGIESAVEAAGTTQTTLKLMTDIELTDDVNDYILLPTDSNVIFDLNGYTLKGNSTYILFSSGNLVIKNGTLTNEYDFGSGLYSNGMLTIESDVTINSAFCGVEVGAGGTCTINGGDISGEYGVVSRGGQIEIKGGNITGTGNSVLTSDTEAGVNISGGNFEGLVFSNGGTIIVTGGTFSDSPANYVDTTAYDVTENTDSGTYTVTAKSEE